MTYLILEIMLYLLTALLLGLVTGWLLHGTRTRRKTKASALPAAPPARSRAEPERLAAARSAQHVEITASQQQRVREMEATLAARQGDSAASAKKLATAMARIRELEGERALQHRAIEVLHQQLELASEWRGKASARSAGTGG